MSTRNPTMRVDWFRVLSDLHKAGKCNAEVARLLGIQRDRVWGWKAGAEPKYCDGIRVLAMWHALQGNDDPPPTALR